MKLPPSSGGTSKGETYSGRPVRKDQSEFLNEMPPLLTVPIFCPSPQSKNKKPIKMDNVKISVSNVQFIFNDFSKPAEINSCT